MHKYLIEAVRTAGPGEVQSSMIVCNGGKRRRLRRIRSLADDGLRDVCLKFQQSYLLQMYSSIYVSRPSQGQVA